jgi:predicted secreted protein
MAIFDQGSDRLLGVAAENRNRCARGDRRLRTVTQSIDHTDKDAPGKWCDQVQVPRIQLARNRPITDSPFDYERG